MTLLHMQVNKDLSESERERLNTVYDRFINQIQHVSKQENQLKPDSLHVFARIRERLTRLLESCCDRKSMQYALIKSALSLIEFEKKLIYLQLKYPGVRDAQSKRRHSPLKISKKYTNSDLMELIAPLSAAGFFCLYDDTPASFMQIVREFEIMCNTRIKNPDNSRWPILGRKNKLTHFLDILRNTLIELSDSIAESFDRMSRNIG